MAALPVSPSDDLTTRLLGPRDGPAAWRFLSRSGVRDVFIASQVWRGALVHGLPDGLPEFHAAFAGSELRALLLFGFGGLVVPAGDVPEEVAALGPALARRAGSVRAIVGESSLVSVLWPFLRSAGVRPRVDVRELFMEADGRTLDPAAREPELRGATLGDVDLLARASARAHLEEMGEDPMARNPEAFLGRVARLVLEGRAFVIRRGPTLLFKAELSALCPLGAQIAGVYTDPAFRNQGLARRGTGETAWQALATTPAVSLFVREDNAPAIRAYARAGFRHTRDHRTLVFRAVVST